MYTYTYTKITVYYGSPETHWQAVNYTPEFGEKIIMNQVFGEGLNALVTPEEKLAVLNRCVAQGRVGLGKGCPEDVAFLQDSDI